MGEPALKIHKPEEVPKKRDRTAFRNFHAFVIQTLAGAGASGMTDEEIALSNGKRQESVRKRRMEMTHASLVEATGLSRKTSYGYKAATWRLTPHGKKLARTLTEGTKS